MGKLNNVWDFVEKYYPSYYQSAEIAENDDLTKIVEGEINGAAETLFKSIVQEIKAGGIADDLQAELLALKEVDSRLEASNADIYERSIEAFITTQQGKVFIPWSIQDVMDRGKDREINLNEKQAEAVLELLESEHDATIGISWDTVDYWTNEVLEEN